MAKKFQNNQQQNKDKCYYMEMFMCTCSSCPQCDDTCTGRENCSHYVSESEYFQRMMNGEISEEAQQEDPQVRQARLKKNLSPGMTRKQRKFEEKKENAKLGDGTGYTFMDDPRFKDLFNDSEKKK